MLKKLSQFFKFLFSRRGFWTKEQKKHFLDVVKKSSSVDLNEESCDEIKEHLDKVRDGVKVPEQAVQMNLDTGKIIMPENMSPEDQAELEQALQEFKAALQGMTGDKFASLEEFINKSSSSLSIPFTTANNLPDAQLQIVEEFSNHEFDTQNWGDYDFVESLVGYENQGYEFVGLEQIYQKYAERRELTEEEAKKVREWYTLVSQELVYDV